MIQRDDFPPADFDSWAETYDQDVITESKFPFDGYERVRGDLWEEEPYWLADESLEALRLAGLKVQYVSAASCAGVYSLESDDNLHPKD